MGVVWRRVIAQDHSLTHLRMKLPLFLGIVALSLSFLAAAVEAGGRGRKGKKVNMKKSQNLSPRVWHLAQLEEDCGNYTTLHTEAKPVDLCLEVNTTICICSTRDDLNSSVEIEWNYKCGLCNFKWTEVKSEEDLDRKTKKEYTKKKKQKMKMKLKEKAKSALKKNKKNKNKNKKRDGKKTD